MVDRNIIAIGGGGFGRSLGNLKIEKHIISLARNDNPNVCFIPTATGDNDAYKVNFYSVFTQLGCNATHVDFFKRTIDLESHIANQDIIFVGGGNTKSMLAVWKDWGLDVILKEAYLNGVIMCGVSAGAICWFEKGISDSWAHDLAIIDCLGFVKGVCCPHYDEEPNRTPYVKKILEQHLIKDCIGIEGNCALHIKNDQIMHAINFGDDKNTFHIKLHDNEISHTEFPVISI